MKDVAEPLSISSQSLTVKQCFNRNLYVIPEFQRPYSWKREELEDFWNDVVRAQGDFFFGSTVTWVSRKDDMFRNTYSVIDGQQRLTTATIALSVIRDSFEMLAEDNADNPLKDIAEQQVEATQLYIVAEDKDEDKTHAILTRQEDSFYRKIQVPSSIPLKGNWEPHEGLIAAARRYFEQQIGNQIEGKPIGDAIAILKEDRKNILQARLIQVELGSEEDGFLVFETLNTRGAELRLSDLVKNRLMRCAATNEKDREAIKIRWSNLERKVLADKDSGEDMDRFIWQSWNSRRKAVKKAQLYKVLAKDLGLDAGKHLEYLEGLEADAAIYCRLGDERLTVDADEKGKRNVFAVPKFVDSVRALAAFKIDLANSAILAIARKYEEKSWVPQKTLIRVLRDIENFHFQFSAMEKSGSTESTRNRWNTFAAEIYLAKNAQSVNDSISRLESKLAASLPDKSDVKKTFTTIFYAPKLTLKRKDYHRGRKAIVAYVLGKFAKDAGVIPVGTDCYAWTIEHLRPQKQGGKNISDPTYSIGNLILLTDALNGTLGDGEWPLKKRELLGRNAYIDEEIERWAESEDAPSDKEIQTRAKALANDAIDRLWAI